MIHRNPSQTSFQSWVQAIRPKTLIASICPIVIAGSLASRITPINIGVLSLALIASFLIQIGCNLANDYYDHKKGADTADRLGPKRGLQNQVLQPRHIKIGFILCLVTAFITGLYLMILGGWPIIAIGLSGLLFAVLYTASPYALAYTGSADLIAFAYFGPLAVGGTVYLLTGAWSTESLFMGACLGAYAVAILTVNNLRDRIQDQSVNKKTLCVRFGRPFGETLYSISMLAPLSYAFFWVQLHQTPYGIAFFIPCLFLSIRNIKAIHKKAESELDPYLGKTAATLALFTISMMGALLIT